jgi:nitrate/TMAO reductase-like tetraheme cytochrome c subunit
MKKTAILSTSSLLAASLLALGTMHAFASENERVPPVRDKLVQKECGACHMTFQPTFLPARSWTKIMAELDNHFGEDASLDVEAAKRIEDYLVANAGRRSWRDSWGTPPQRITELRWFKKEHRGEVSPRARKKAGTMANCKACHLTAEQGNYDND